LYGPMGIGKTSILETVRRAVENKNRPCGYSAQTRSLSDLTAALLRVYPNINGEGCTPRQLRNALRFAVERNPGALLLDHLHSAGTQFKKYLGSLRRSGLGVLFAADAEDPRDHMRFRSMHLAWREMEVAPLPARTLRRILAESLADKSLPHPLSEANLSALLKAAHGRPGWILMMADLLQNPCYWSGGSVHVESLRASVMIMMKKKYLVCPKGAQEEEWQGFQT